MPTVAVLGAGPGLGVSVGRIFGRHGYDVALIARNREKLDSHVAQLTSEGVTAARFVADVTDRDAIRAALAQTVDRFGPIDLLEFSPYSPAESFKDLLDVNVENDLLPHVDGILVGGITAATEVLPHMLAAGAGTLIFTAGSGAITPYPMLAAVNAAQAGLRNYVQNLNAVVAGRGVYATFVMVGAFIGSEAPEGHTSIEPDDLAQIYWDMHTERTDVERTIRGS